MPIQSLRLRILFFAALCGLVACGPKPLPPSSALDTAERQYARGLSLFDSGDIRAAAAAFERARSLDPDHPGGYVGSALVSMERGDVWSARQDIDIALHKDKSFADAYVALGRVITRQGQERGGDADSWLAEALRAYDQAQRIDPDHDGAAFYRARSQYWAGDFAGARASLLPILERNRGPLVAPAMALTERIQMIERASPGTAQGVAVARSERLTRAELAVLLMEELKLSELVQQRRPQDSSPAYRPPGAPAAAPDSVADIAHSWARPWIEELLALGVAGLELAPDGSFHPDEPVTRAAFARVTAGVLELITAQPDLATRYVGQPSPFPDVRADSYSFNAIALNVDRGIMSADAITGRFNPADPVSGAEALATIRKLQNAVRLEF